MRWDPGQNKKQVVLAIFRGMGYTVDLNHFYLQFFVRNCIQECSQALQYRSIILYFHH